MNFNKVQAARVTLRLSMTIEDLADKLDFPHVSGPYLHELWKYHKRVRADLKLALFEFRSTGFPDDVELLRCHSPRRWLDDYIESIGEAPHLFVLIEFTVAKARHIGHSESACSCVAVSNRVIPAFWEALTAVVRRTIEKVRRAGVIRPHLDDEYEHPQADLTLAILKEELVTP